MTTITAAARRLPGVPVSVGQARELVRDALAGHPAAEAAALCVSELVTNAITYTRSGHPGGSVLVAVELAAPDSVACLRVYDQGPRGVPARCVARAGEPPAALAEHGHGLRIVAALADAGWGTYTSSAGACVWCAFGGES